MEPKIRKSWNSKTIPESCSWPAQGLDSQIESCRGISGSAPVFERNGLPKSDVNSIKEKTSRNYTREERFHVKKIPDSSGRKASAQKSCRNIMGRSCSFQLTAPKAKKEYRSDCIAESTPKGKNDCSRRKNECVHPEEPSLIDKTDHFQAFDRLIEQSVQQEYFEEHKFRAILRDAFKNE